MKIAASLSLGLAAAVLVSVYGPTACAVMSGATALGVYCTFTWLERRRS